MRIVWKVRALAVLGLMIAGMLFVGSNEHASARPAYPKYFIKEYKNLEEQAKKEKCNVCHYGKSKKNRNDYGTALSKEILKINKKGNVKEDDFDKCAKLVEKEKSSVEGKTFGDLIKEGKLPGKEPEKSKDDKDDDDSDE